MSEPDSNARPCPECGCDLACKCLCHPIVPIVYQPIYTARTFMGPFTWTSS